MKCKMDDIKKQLAHQIAGDFYSRFESNEDKLQRRKDIQSEEALLQDGLELEGAIKLPGVSESHAMLLRGISSKIEMPKIPGPVGFNSTAGAEKRQEMEKRGE